MHNPPLGCNADGSKSPRLLWLKESQIVVDKFEKTDNNLASLLLKGKQMLFNK